MTHQDSGPHVLLGYKGKQSIHALKSIMRLVDSGVKDKQLYIDSPHGHLTAVTALPAETHKPAVNRGGSALPGLPWHDTLYGHTGSRQTDKASQAEVSSNVRAVTRMAYLREPEIALNPEGLLPALGRAQYAEGQRADAGTLDVGCVCCHRLLQPLRVTPSVDINLCGTFLLSGEVPKPGFLLFGLPNPLQPSRLYHMLQSIYMS
ncbi:MAG: hypothetical protein FRX49_09786 [Trebouxia sp. A1-2]|nr:MAG: hypothetical protein FRX49_09786 [Trebouxia sp. A1-2]